MSDYEWKYVSDQEYFDGKENQLTAAAPRPVGPKPPIYETQFKIFPVASPGKIYQDGGNIEEISQGEKIKILTDRWENGDWVYKVSRLSIRLGNGYEVSLKKGTRIAVLPKDYRQQLERQKDGGDGNRDGGGRGGATS
tara:strand:+ start:686 stop:1099 length:414 start_codon:yes stop_codon:yes gene_type:complete